MKSSDYFFFDCSTEKLLQAFSQIWPTNWVSPLAIYHNFSSPPTEVELYLPSYSKNHVLSNMNCGDISELNDNLFIETQDGFTSFSWIDDHQKHAYCRMTELEECALALFIQKQPKLIYEAYGSVS